jgi:hypothetical protein
MISHVPWTQLWSPVHPTQDRPPQGVFFIMGNLSERLTPEIFCCKIKVTTCEDSNVLGLISCVKGPGTAILEGRTEIFRPKGKIPFLHTMDLYVNLLHDHFYTLHIFTSCMGIFFWCKNFTQLQI